MQRGRGSGRMFDFVISGNKKRRPAKRVFASLMISSFVHIIVILVLIKYPELLRAPGPWDIRILWQQPKDDLQNWRTVAVVSTKMTMPSSETLKKLFSDSEKKAPGAKTGPIRINPIEAKVSNQPSEPKVPTKVKSPPSSLARNEVTQPDSGSAQPKIDNPEPAAGNSGNVPAVNQEMATALPSVPEPKPDVAPISVPDTILNPVPTAPVIPEVAVKENHPSEGAKKTIRRTDVFPESDHNGFPMGEYTNLIVELIKEKWLIPSYLKDSQGHTTVLFYIDKKGRTMNVRILSGSGSDPLDRAALSAVLSCNLPALPKDFPGDHVGVRFVFSYNENP
jgi:TonB family protein